MVNESDSKTLQIITEEIPLKKKSNKIVGFPDHSEVQIRKKF